MTQAVPRRSVGDGGGRFLRAGVAGMAGAVLAAATLEGRSPGAGYDALMVGWAGFALVYAAAAWAWSARAPRDRERVAGFADLWVRVAAVPVMLLVVKAAGLLGGDHVLWAAASMGLLGLAGAAVAAMTRRESRAFAAGLAVNAAASLAVAHVHADQPPADWWVRLVQANLLSSAGVAVVWLAARGRFVGDARGGPLLNLQIAAGLVGNALMFAVPTAWLILDPSRPHADLGRAGDAWGWAALLGSVAAAGLYLRHSAASAVNLLVPLALTVAAAAACSAAAFDTGDWLALHVLIAGWAAVAVGVTVARDLADRRRVLPATGASDPLDAPPPDLSVPLAGWLWVVALAVAALGVRSAWDDPARPVWSAGAALLAAAALGRLGQVTGGSAAVYASGLLLMWAAVAVRLGFGPAADIDLVHAAMIGAGAASLIWLAVDKLLPATADPDRPPVGETPLDATPFWVAVPWYGSQALLVTGAGGLSHALGGPGFSASGPLMWPAWIALTLAIAVLMWVREARFAPGALHAAGVGGILLALQGNGLTPREIGFAAAPALASWCLAVGAAWRTGLHRVLRMAAAIDDPDTTATPRRLPMLLVPMALTAAVLSVWIAVSSEPVLSRLAGPASAAMLAVAVALGTGAGRAAVALWLGVLAAVELGWATTDPAHPAVWAVGTVRLLAVLSLLSPLYGLVLARVLPEPWAPPAARAGPVLGFAALAAVPLLLAQEALALPATVGADSAIMAAAAMLGLAAAGVFYAVTPAGDPFGLTGRARTAYVYAAELLLALMFVHLRLSLPELFAAGLMATFWPFVIIGVAFAGAGAAEFFRRRGLDVLAEPLERTGVFLPVLPLLGFWLLPPERHSAAGMMAGVLYAALALRHRSLGFLLMAAAAGNAGLWSLWHANGVEFLSRPQVWLIPPALAVLLAEHLHRAELGPRRAAALRYLALCAVYLSSTAEMFLHVAAQGPQLALVLAGLSVAGVMAGILLRVTAFLFTGTAFLLLVVLSMIRYAASDLQQTWVWYAAGIALGALIIATFAVFEKRRNDVMRLLEDMRTWT